MTASAKQTKVEVVFPRSNRSSDILYDPILRAGAALSAVLSDSTTATAAAAPLLLSAAAAAAALRRFAL